MIYDDDFVDGLVFLVKREGIEEKDGGGGNVIPELMEMTQEEIVNECRVYGLPREGDCVGTLNTFLKLRKDNKIK